MRRIRKVYLQNAAGDRWGLNGENGVYVSSLAGFGYTLSPTYADLTRGFFLAVSGESEPQGTVPFTVYFTRNAYAVYQSFVDWLAAAGTVILCYNPTGDQEYRRDVDVNFLQKGELNEVGWLEVPSSFYVKTPWYKPYATTLSLETAGGDSSKRYDYVYDSSLMYGVDSSGSLAGELRGGGHIPGSLELSYYGAITNPKIRMVGNLSGKTFGICSVTAVLIASDRLEYSSRREQSYVRKVSADGTVTDLLDSLDLSTTPFPHIPVDEPVTISIEGGEEVAKRTFNPHIGVEGGLSVLGTSGIVEPMSQQAILDTIQLEMNQAALRAGSPRRLILAPGNYGLDYLHERYPEFHAVPVVKTSNFIGDTLDMAATARFEEVLLVGHVGKLVKVAGGIMNTHSHTADCRTELFCTHAALCGASREVCAALMNAATTDACLELLDSAGLRAPVLESLLRAVQLHLDRRACGAFRVGAVLFSNQHGPLGATDTAAQLLNEWKEH